DQALERVLDRRGRLFGERRRQPPARDTLGAVGGVWIGVEVRLDGFRDRLHGGVVGAGHGLPLLEGSSGRGESGKRHAVAAAADKPVISRRRAPGERPPGALSPQGGSAIARHRSAPALGTTALLLGRERPMRSPRLWQRRTAEGGRAGTAAHAFSAEGSGSADPLGSVAEHGAAEAVLLDQLAEPAALLAGDPRRE